MRRLGDVLMWLGVVVGALIGLGLQAGITVPGIPWLFALGLVKLSLLAVAGLIGGGAVLRRLGLRAEERAVLPDGRHHADPEP